MWLFLQRRLRMWLIMAVALPVFVATLGLVRRQLESHTGPNRVTRGISQVEGFTRGFRRKGA